MRVLKKCIDCGSERDFDIGAYQCPFCNTGTLEEINKGLKGYADKWITKDSGKRQVYSTGMQRDSDDKPLYTEVYFPLIRRHAELMMRGAKKYDRGNWRKASTEEELQRAKDSLLRHTIQYLSGDRDEDHLAAIIFNTHLAAMIEDKLKEKDNG